MSGNTRADNVAQPDYVEVPMDLPQSQVDTWYTVTRGLPRGHFEPHHVPLLRRYCQLVHMMNELTNWENEVMAEHGIDGMFYVTGSGQHKNRPQVDRAAAVTTELIKLATKLQILPSYSQATATRRAEAAQDRALDSDGEDLLYNRKRH
ncbi:hypothetical protein [Ruegeria sp. HKCCD6604]|uniref:hypothetical protein n=1 Tax=Ruegeria sp. HKCCD6604 TaxID=2683000 RepID=UPI001491D7E3|nr:hypothetical protein [Ruegeria sp. HKCCD6604]NOC91562.1 hypothetical protein [Ruegeria sp. HKCCD6604]